MKIGGVGSRQRSWLAMDPRNIRPGGKSVLPSYFEKVNVAYEKAAERLKVASEGVAAAQGEYLQAQEEWYRAALDKRCLDETLRLQNLRPLA